MEPAPETPKSKSRLVPVLLVLLLAGLAVIAGSRLVRMEDSSQSPKHIAELEDTKPAQVDLVFSNRPILAGQRLDESMLTTLPADPAFLKLAAVPPEDIDLIVGKIAVSDIPKDYPILLTVIRNEEVSRPASAVAHDRRALSLAVPTVSPTGALFQAGDRIDILYLHKADSVDSLTYSRVLLQNVLVIGTGDQIGSSGKLGIDGSPDRITVQVTTEEALILSVALQNGELGFLLRNPKDILTSTYSVFSTSDLQAGELDASASSPDENRLPGFPVIFQGGESQAVTTPIEQENSLSAPDPAPAPVTR